MKTILIILYLFMTVFASGQGKADKELTMFIKKQKLDTFLLVKRGCQTCAISYEDSLKTVDTLSIFLLYQKNDQLTLISFTDTGKIKQFDNLQSDIFNFIIVKRQVLKQADTYYKEQKLANFQAPCLATFPYEKIKIQIGQFRHSHTLVEREMDNCGSNLTREDWFITEVQILKMLDRLLPTN